MIACEEGFPLISTEEQATLRSGVINTSSLIGRLTIFLASGPATASVPGPQIFEAYEGATSSLEAISLPLSNLHLFTDVVEWAQRRNLHRLALVAGKQACLEGWRHLTEIGLRMLHFLGRTSPDTLATGVNIPVSRRLYSATIGLLTPLLSQASAPESTPAVLKVLASGSALSLAAFLQIFASPTSADGSTLLSSKAGGTQGILGVTQLLFEAVLTSSESSFNLPSSKLHLTAYSFSYIEPNQQRVRANYYGALCYILDVCHQFGKATSIWPDLIKN